MERPVRRGEENGRAQGRARNDSKTAEETCSNNCIIHYCQASVAWSEADRLFRGKNRLVGHPRALS